MNRQVKDNAAPAANVEEETTASDAPCGELHELSAEIVDLFYTQAFSPDDIRTPSDVCEAFSDILLRHWKLCCIVIYLRGGDGHLSETAIRTNERLDGAKAREVGGLLADAVEREGRELRAGLSEGEESNDEAAAHLLRPLADAGLSACVAVPIHARGSLVGALVALTSAPERLRAALNGIRFIAAPIIIAVGNARRAAAINEQHDHIEHLVEELQQRSTALTEANRELRRVAQYRSLFLARMSHELRTPLTAILGFSEILIDQERLTDSQRRFCEKIQASGMQLQASLNQLVDLSRLEAGQTEIFLHEFSLREALRDACAAVARLAQKQDVKIDCSSALDGATIVSDESKLRQVLYNFLAYAISRSPVGEHVTVRAESVAPSRFKLRIEDRGETLSDMSRVFEPVEIDAPSGVATSMNELGLVIARRLIDVLGGTITLENAAPHGLKVSIELPTRPNEGAGTNT